MVDEVDHRSRLEAHSVLVERALQGVREWTALTPGQQWTAALLLLLTTAVLIHGSPSQSIGVLPPVGRPSGAVVTAPQLPDRAPASVNEPVGEPFAPTPPSGSSRGASPPLVDAVSEPTATGGSDVASSPPPGAADVVAVVRGESFGPTGTDERAIAEKYLRRAAFTWSTVVVDDVAATCDAVAAAGQVVVAGEGFGQELTECLVGEGTLIVAHDPYGHRDETRTGGGVISTRRSVTQSLVDLAIGLGDDVALDGNVGIVASAAYEEQVKAAVPLMRRAGVDVEATSYLTGEADVPAAVLGFAGQGISTVVFATDVTRQSAWVAQHSLLDPGVGYVVVDAGTAVLEERYPATFDGALAHTTLRVPWFSRTHGPTPAQNECRRVHQPGVAGDIHELVLAYQWCQHVHLVDTAIREALTDGAGLGRSLRTSEVASPLTSNLGPLGDGTFGPTGDAVLRWSVDCGCWIEQQPFRERP